MATAFIGCNFRDPGMSAFLKNRGATFRSAPVPGAVMLNWRSIFAFPTSLVFGRCCARDGRTPKAEFSEPLFSRLRPVLPAVTNTFILRQASAMKQRGRRLSLSIFIEKPCQVAIHERPWDAFRGSAAAFFCSTHPGVGCLRFGWLPDQTFPALLLNLFRFM